MSSVFVLGYFVWWPTRHEGQTFGKKFQKIQVAIIEDEAKGKIRVMDKQDLVPALIRWLLMIVDGIAFGLVGYFFITQSPNMQRLGDQIAKTCVIRYQDKPATKTSTTKKTTTKKTTKK